MLILLKIAHLLAAGFYIFAWIQKSDKTLFWIRAGLACHALSLYGDIAETGVWRFGIGPIISGTLWVGLLVLWIEDLRLPVLRSTTLLVASVSVFLPLIFPGSDVGLRVKNPLFFSHLVIATLAYGVIALASAHALLMWMLQKKLQNMSQQHMSDLVLNLEKFPPLLLLERILFRFIGIGFCLLSMTVLSGAWFSEEIFGHPFSFEPKIVCALIAWLIFGALLLGRWKRGWRGKTALRLTLSGSFLVLVAYIGTHTIFLSKETVIKFLESIFLTLE